MRDSSDTACYVFDSRPKVSRAESVEQTNNFTVRLLKYECGPFYNQIFSSHQPCARVRKKDVVISTKCLFCPNWITLPVKLSSRLPFLPLRCVKLASRKSVCFGRQLIGSQEGITCFTLSGAFSLRFSQWYLRLPSNQRAVGCHMVRWMVSQLEPDQGTQFTGRKPCRIQLRLLRLLSILLLRPLKLCIIQCMRPLISF